ncbi:MAG: HNH endonuclease [Planctomycetaceae bacterium]|jgi:hypothetical protein|nr:HNH endonuclease [Planctomycetaceae bacterium]
MSIAKRRNITPNFDARLLTEANNLCPFCGKRLLGEKTGQSVKLYEIAHIYPHSPTSEQLVALENVPKYNDAESFENLIALCQDCHTKQDFHTTAEDYMQLYNLKQKIMGESKAMDSASNVPIETQIGDILQKLKSVDTTLISPLSYTPVAVEQKIGQENSLLREKVKAFVVQYFPFVQDMFGQLDGIGKQKFDKIATEVKLCFQSMEEQGLSQEAVFDGIVKWIKSKTQSQYGIACEIIVAFFIQNCEVFDEITK